MLSSIKRYFGTGRQNNPFSKQVQKTLKVASQELNYFSLPALGDKRVDKLPYSIRVLLECAVRNCDQFNFKQSDVEKILDWKNSSKEQAQIPFKPARVLLQDFTGVPALVDLAAMRDAMQRIGGDPAKINPLCPVDLVIDHSVQVDVSRSQNARAQNERLEFQRNRERFEFLKWGQNALKNVKIIPPGSGIVHQVNLEYLARVVFCDSLQAQSKKVLYPDSVVGTDSHTTMINGLGVTGWGVGGIQAQAVMLGQPISMVLPEVVGFKLTGKLPPTTTATDLVLTITSKLRQRGVVGKFVEFFGDGCAQLTLADRATIANMSPEYGATMGYFPIDKETIKYLELTGRDKERTAIIEDYLKVQGLFRQYGQYTQAQDPQYSGEIMQLDLGTVESSLAGPKRPHDRVSMVDLKKQFTHSLTNQVGFKGYGLKEQAVRNEGTLKDGNKLQHGSVVMAAITSCTNTSNPDVMLAAGILAKNAVQRGLSVAPYIKTSLSPGSGVVESYFQKSGVLPFLQKLGFNVTGYGCMTCIGNSGELMSQEVSDLITQNDLVTAAVLSGNRNFQGRVHPLTRANYLASPPLVVAYALAGRVDIDFEKESIGKDSKGKDVFLKQIWPSRKDVQKIVNQTLKPEMFNSIYSSIITGNKRWNQLKIKQGLRYHWDEKSTYIHNPPFFADMQSKGTQNINGARCLAFFGDSITTDHISPAGNIAKTSPAAKYLTDRGIQQKDFNSYGSRRGNDEIMARGTFANVRLINRMASKVGPFALHIPSKTETSVFDAAQMYKKQNTPLIILAGSEYGSGSSRDWAAKGPYLQGVKVVIAKSYERIHRTNLVGMGILPLQFEAGSYPEDLNLDGSEIYDFDLNDLEINSKLNIKVTRQNGDQTLTVPVNVRLDTAPELQYYKSGGILKYVLRKLVQSS